jgi:transcriptional regulator with XRE-family HTH domain
MRIKSLIKDKQVTQAETASACDISLGTLRGWMCKKIIPPLDDAYKLSAYLGVSLEFLIGGQDKNKAAVIKELLFSLKNMNDRS